MTARNVLATSNRKTTPLQVKESMPYKSWKNRVKMWQLVTFIPKKEQAIVIMLESEKRKRNRKSCERIHCSWIKHRWRYGTFNSKLDSIFQGETIDEACNTYLKFINFSRQENSDMNDYIIEFEHLHKKMKLPNSVLAFKLLDGLVLVMIKANSSGISSRKRYDIWRYKIYIKEII